jgi:hypothetical protein
LNQHSCHPRLSAHFAREGKGIQAVTSAPVLSQTPGSPSLAARKCAALAGDDNCSWVEEFAVRQTDGTAATDGAAAGTKGWSAARMIAWQTPQKGWPSWRMRQLKDGR